MKPTNWRTYYGYKPSRSLALTQRDRNPCIEDNYKRWLAKQRGWTIAEVETYIGRMDRRTLISATYAPEPVQLVVKNTRPDPIGVMCAKIRDKLTWDQVEALQNAIDQRLAA